LPRACAPLGLVGSRLGYLVLIQNKKKIWKYLFPRIFGENDGAFVYL